MHQAQRSLGGVLFPVLALLLALVFNKGEYLLSHLPGSVAFAPSALAFILLIGCVIAALAHAEVVSARLGEPFGTLFLTIAVTIIEMSIVVSMVESGTDDPTEARESVFAAIMIVCNGLVGICLLLGGLRHREQEIHPMGASAYLAVLTALSVTTLILPNHTRSTFGPTLSAGQLAFVSILSVVLYGAFLFIQTVRHRSYFVDANYDADHVGERPDDWRTMVALIWLGASLLGVVFLSRPVIANVEEVLRDIGVADVNAVAGASMALLVLLPEALNAIRAAMRNSLQTALNGALGSILATVGLTVPAVAAVSLIGDHELILGLDSRDSVMLMLTLLLSVISFGAGRTNVLTGFVHLVVFATYVFLLFVP